VHGIAIAGQRLSVPDTNRARFTSDHLGFLKSTFGVDARAVLSSAPPGYQLSVADDQLDLGRFIVEKRREYDFVNAFAAALAEDKVAMCRARRMSKSIAVVCI
jgi:DNA-binding SARP family transcriptional activator